MRQGSFVKRSFKVMLHALGVLLCAALVHWLLQGLIDVLPFLDPKTRFAAKTIVALVVLWAVWCLFTLFPMLWGALRFEAYKKSKSSLDLRVMIGWHMIWIALQGAIFSGLYVAG